MVAAAVSPSRLSTGFANSIRRADSSRQPTIQTDGESSGPWFAVPPGHGGLRSFTAQAGDGFRRRIDHATQAKPLFAVSGIPGTVGSGTRDFWKALIPVLAGKRDFAVWPFEGELPDLFATRGIVLAETYPALAYAAALATDLPTHRVRVAKTQQTTRDRVCGHLEQMPWVVANGVDLGDLGPTRTNEDDFDAHLTAAAVLRCVLEGTPLTRSEWIDAEAEGSMRLAGPVDLNKGAVNLLSRVRGRSHATRVPARSTVGAGTRGSYVGFRPHPRGHCQVDVERTGSASNEAMTQPSDSDTRHLTPDPEGTRAQQAMVDGAQEVTAETEQIQHDAVHRQETLRVRSRLEAPHLAFPLSRRLVRDFGAVVRILIRAVDYRRHHHAARRRVTAQLVGDQSSGDTSLAFQQLQEKAHRRPPIAPGLDQDVDHIAILVDRAPEIVLPPLNRDE